MIKKKIKYETKDGQEFSSLADAQKHEILHDIKMTRFNQRGMKKILNELVQMSVEAKTMHEPSVNLGDFVIAQMTAGIPRDAIAKAAHDISHDLEAHSNEVEVDHAPGEPDTVSENIHHQSADGSLLRANK